MNDFQWKGNRFLRIADGNANPFIADIYAKMVILGQEFLYNLWH